MNIISDKYKNLIKNMLEKLITTNLDSLFSNLIIKNCIDNYINIIKNIDNITFDIAQSLFQNIFTIIDDQFMNSSYRKQNFDSKGFKQRSLWTCFGFITINRRIYKNKVSKKYYIHVDRYFSLPKYDKFDPYVCSLVIDAISDNNSMIKVGRQIGELIDKKVNIDNYKNEISRQQVKNIIYKASNKNLEEDIVELNTPENIYVMADEKWIHNQREIADKTMVKSIIIFDDKIKVSKDKAKKIRSKLINRHVISKVESDIWLDVLNYIDYVYDEDKLKNIFILGDGGKWIKSGINELKFNKNIKVTYCADKFHPMLAINNITKDKVEHDILVDYMINNNRKPFKLLCNSLINKYEIRKDVIEDKMNYILNNWQYIQNSYKKCHVGCSMESHISHFYASNYTSVPKGYKTNSLKFLIKLRDMHENNSNIRNIYLNSYIEKEYHSFDDIPYENHNNSNLPILNGLNCGAKNTIYSIAHC